MLDKVPCLVQMFITADKCDNTTSRLKHKETRTCGPRMQVVNERRNIKHSEKKIICKIRETTKEK